MQTLHKNIAPHLSIHIIDEFILKQDHGIDNGNGAVLAICILQTPTLHLHTGKGNGQNHHIGNRVPW